MFVRVREAQQQFTKDLLDYPVNTPENVGKEPRLFRVHVHGYDELGRPTMPLHEVEDCTEIQNAIHNDKRRDPRPTDDKMRNPDGFLVPSTLVQVLDQDVESFPRWVGHPIVQMSAEEVYTTVQRIRAEQPKGDRILGEHSKPYGISDTSDDPLTKELRSLYDRGRKTFYRENNSLPETDQDEIPAAWSKKKD